MFAREQVVNNLRLHDVSVTENEHEGPFPVYTLCREDVLEIQPLPPRVSRHMVGRLSAKFNIPMGSFFQAVHHQ